MDTLNEIVNDLPDLDTLLWVIFWFLLLAVLVRLAYLANSLANRNQTIGKPKSGHIMIVAVGEMVTKFIMTGVEGKGIDPETGEVYDGPESRGLADSDSLAAWFLELTGWWWLGLLARSRWTKINHKEFMSVEEDGTLDVNSLHECEMMLEQVPFRKSYAMLVPRAETSERYDLDILVLVTLEVTNAKKAYVEIEDASLNALSSAQSEIRGWSSVKTNKKLLETQSEAGNAEAKGSLLTGLLKLNEGEKGISARYGLMISDIDIRQIRLPKDIRDAMQKVAKAEQTKKETIILAEGEAEAELKKGLAVAQVLTAKVKGLNGDHQSLEQIELADAIRVAQPEMLSLGSTGILPTADRNNFRRRRPRGEDGRRTPRPQQGQAPPATQN